MDAGLKKLAWMVDTITPRIEDDDLTELATDIPTSSRGYRTGTGIVAVAECAGERVSRTTSESLEKAKEGAESWRAA